MLTVSNACRRLAGVTFGSATLLFFFLLSSSSSKEKVFSFHDISSCCVDCGSQCSERGSRPVRWAIAREQAWLSNPRYPFGSHCAYAFSRTADQIGMLLL